MRPRGGQEAMNAAELPMSDECTCACHTTGAIHIINCCFTCEVCGKRIVRRAWAEHQKACKRATDLQSIRTEALNWYAARNRGK